MFLVSCLTLIGSGCTGSCTSPPTPDPIVAVAPTPIANPLRVGIQLHSSPGMLLYQGQLAKLYSQRGVNVDFLTSPWPHSPQFTALPKNPAIFEFMQESQEESSQFGRPTIHALYKGLNRGYLDCVASTGVGFVRNLSGKYADSQQAHAVMTLGQATADYPAAVLMVKKGLNLSKAKTWEGLRVPRFRTNNLGNALVDALCLQAGGDLSKVSYSQIKSTKALRKSVKAGEVDLAIVTPRMKRIFLKHGRYRQADAELASVASPGMFQQLLVCSDSVLEERSEDMVEFLTAFRLFVKRHSEASSASDEPESSADQSIRQRQVDGRAFSKRRRGGSKDHSAARPVDIASLEAIKQVLAQRVTFKEGLSVASHVNTVLMERALAAELPAGEAPSPTPSPSGEQ